MRVFLFALLVSSLSFAQEVLDNKAIIDLKELGFEDSVIIDKINNTDANFSTEIDDLKSLKDSGITSEVLSAMIKKSKKQVVDKKEDNIANQLSGGLEYYDHINMKGETIKVSLLRDQYFKNLTQVELMILVSPLTSEAIMKLKEPSSFELSTVRLYRNKKLINYAEISFTGQNDYGAKKSSILRRKFEYVNENYAEEIKGLTEDENDEVYYYTKCYVDKMRTPLKGRIVIKEDSIVIFSEASGYMGEQNIPTPTPNREYITEDHWIDKQVYNGIEVMIEFDKKDKKYKTDSGVLTYKAGFSTLYYPLKSSK